MENLATKYIDKTSNHLFTNDDKTFMKVLKVGDHAIKIEFGEKSSVKILHNIEHWETESSAGKIYLSQHLKWSIFLQWGPRYHSVTGWKALNDLFNKVTESFSPDLDYSSRDVRKSEEERLKNVISEWEIPARKIAA